MEERSSVHADLSLQLPEDQRWPFGGSAHQRIEASENALRLRLSVTAGKRAMPAVIGWHPWFRKPERLDFKPSAMDVGNFLELQRTFHRDRKLRAAAEEQGVLLVAEALGELLDVGIERECVAHGAGQRLELAHERFVAFRLEAMILIDGDPTRDITDINKIDTTIKGGKVYDPVKIEAALGILPRH